MNRRSFIGAVLAAAAAPAFVRTLSSPIWVPQASRLGEWGDRFGVASAELIDASGAPLCRETISYSARDEHHLEHQWQVDAAALIFGVRLTRGADVRQLRFDSGPRALLAGDSLIATIRLAQPLGARR
jgi:hypothetical protein